MAASEDDLHSLAPIQPAAWLYFTEKNTETCKILSLLSMCDRSSPIVIAPFLADLTIDRDLSTAVRTPISVHEDGVLTKVTSFCPFVLFVSGTDDIILQSEDHGNVGELCRQTRVRYGIQEYENDLGIADTDLAAIAGLIECPFAEYLTHIAVGNAMKEFLYLGRLIMCPEEVTEVQIGACRSLKIPLYPDTLFCVQDDGTPCDYGDNVDINAVSSRVAERRLFNSSLSETLHYYLFTSWGQTIRFADTRLLIHSALRQFVNDTQQTVKLAPHKRYYGYMSQKLSNTERDQLMLCDATVCELAFSFASVYLDAAYEPGPCVNYYDWPMVRDAENGADLVRRLSELKLHLSMHVGALVFSSNSVLYHNRIAFFPAANRVPAGGTAQDGLLRAIQFCSGLASVASEDVYTDSKKIAKGSPPVKDDKYSPYHLAWACATCPQLVSEYVWYLNRLPVYHAGGSSGGSVVINHVVNCVASLCEACGGRCCHSCYATAFVRMGSRFPGLPKQPRKEPFVVTLLSRFLNDVDVLGGYGRRYGNDGARAGGGGGVPPDQSKGDDQTGVGGASGRLAGGNVDRVKHYSQILEYCKKHSLLDPVSGEETLNVRSKSDFVSLLSSLNKQIDEAALNFVGDVKLKSNRDDVSGATQSFNLDMSPYGVCFSPLLVHQYYKVVLLVIQNLGLVNATGYVVDTPLTGACISRWLNQHFQSICGAFSGVSSRKGFLFTRDAKSSSNVEFGRIMDFRTFAMTGRYAKASLEIKLCRLSVSSLRTCRIKNRPVFRSKAGPTNAYFKKDSSQRKTPVKGCLAFLLHRHHGRLFPGCSMSCLEMWQKICTNSMPRSVDIGVPEEFNAFVRFVLSVTNDYNDQDLIDVQPDTLLSYIEYRFYNKFLFFFGFKEYLSTLHGLSTTLTPQSFLQYPYLLGGTPRFGSVAEYTQHMQRLKAGGAAPPYAVGLRKESLPRLVFEARSLVTVSFGIEKYATSSSNSRDFFHFAQIGYFSGNGVERSLNSGFGQDYRFMRQRHVLATKLLGLVIKQSKRDNVIFDVDVTKNRVMMALDSVDVDPELAALSELFAACGEDVPERDDVLFFVDGQEHVAAALVDKMARIVDGCGGRVPKDCSVEGLRRVLHGGGSPDGNGSGAAAGGVESPSCDVYDLSAVLCDESSSSSSALDVVNVGEELADSEYEAPLKRFRL